MSMKFANRDFQKKPLTRKCTQIFFDPNCEEEAPFRAQQHHNQGGRLDTTAIVSKAFQSGVITHTRDATARYIDATAIHDFRLAMNTKVYADAAFNQIHPDIRKQFDSQEAFVAFCLDEKNLDQLREWGLAAPLKTPEAIKPQEVIIVNPEAKASDKAA
jgi:hypothetical protein